MDSFYTIVIAVAVILLIIILTYVGILLSEKKLSGENQVAFPPIANTCPDNWEAKIHIDTNGVENVYCAVPTDATTKNVGTILDTNTTDSTKTNAEVTTGYNKSLITENNNQVGVIDFNSNLWAADGKTPDCAKKAWADTYDIQWDGISNYTKCE